MDSVKIYTVEMILSSMTLHFWFFVRYIYRRPFDDKQYGAHPSMCACLNTSIAARPEGYNWLAKLAEPD